MKLQTELTETSIVWLDSDFKTIYSAPLNAVLLFIEDKGLNATGETERDYFEERNVNGFSYTTVDVPVLANPKTFLVENFDEVVEMYLQFEILKKAA